MVDRPIIFSAPMVRALLDGRKTQTRRVLPSAHPRHPHHCHLRTDVMASGENAVWYWDGEHDRVGASLPLRFALGDRLWVREAHALVPATAYRASIGVESRGNPADPDQAAVYREGWERCKPGSWRPSIHMPRWASRLTLTVADVRVQRLQEISEDDARAEGACSPAVCEALNLCGGHEAGMCACQCVSPSDLFSGLWETIHGAGAWEANPWVVAITFSVERRNIDTPSRPGSDA